MKASDFQIIKKMLPGIRQNVSLAQYTSFRIGGKAKYFFIAKSKEELIRAVSAAQKMGLPFFLLGGGSNLLVSDRGFKGIVIKMQNQEYRFSDVKITAGAGAPLAAIVAASAQQGLIGLEWAIGIPGTVGGAVFGNAGSFGESMRNIVEKVEVLDLKNLKIKNYDAPQYGFSYRESVFKKKKKFIIISVILSLKAGSRGEINKKLQEFAVYKRNAQPLNFPSAGSVFKNPKSVAAGVLIEQCGLKGKKIGGAMISEKHANFIVNVKNAKARDVKALINLIKRKVSNKFKIKLEEEIRFL